jgi:hypothetical protein
MAPAAKKQQSKAKPTKRPADDDTSSGAPAKRQKTATASTTSATPAATTTMFPRGGGNKLSQLEIRKIQRDAERQVNSGDVSLFRTEGTRKPSAPQLTEAQLRKRHKQKQLAQRKKKMAKDDDDDDDTNNDHDEMTAQLQPPKRVKSLRSPVCIITLYERYLTVITINDYL